MKFSQRIGKTHLTKEVQLDSIDNELKNGLWNIYDLFILQKISNQHDYSIRMIPSVLFSNSLWHNYFKKPIDQIPNRFSGTQSEIRNYFFSCEWYNLYDFIEFNIDLVNENGFRQSINIDELCQSFNEILEREFAGYRFIEKILSPITNTTEIEEIEESFSVTESFTSLKSCNTHLKSALLKLSDRLNPDYRNSIKESISALESIAKIISNNPKDSLGGALDKIKGKLKIHSALERGFKQIYGYTSDTDGIRHALTEETSCDFEDAKFMLVSCSAFINYLVIKANKAQIVIT
jgi:hypothetical protein